MNGRSACPDFDARAWVGWLLAAAAFIMLVRNPLYFLLVLVVARLVARRCARPEQGLSLAFGRLAVVVLLLSTFFNLLFAHVGGTVLGELPAGWPLIGGPLTLESAVYGANNGLLLLALLALFLAFNNIVPPRELVRLAPRAFQDLGVVVLIALTYVPETVRHLERIREAQAVRGHRLRGLRDWQPLVVPLLAGGLERAMTLAEAMVARGYGATTGRAPSNLLRGGLVAGLLLALLGWGMAFWWGWPGWLLLAAACVLLVVLVWRVGRHSQHTRYNPRPWYPADTALLLCALLPLLALFVLGPDVVAYNPYPLLTLPAFHRLLALAVLALAFPAIPLLQGTPQVEK